MGTVEASGFFQDPPRLRDEWEDDLAMQRYLERVLPADVHAEVRPSLAEMGRLAATELKDWSDAMDDPATSHGCGRSTPGATGSTTVETSPYWDRIAEVAHAARRDRHRLRTRPRRALARPPVRARLPVQPRRARCTRARWR